MAKVATLAFDALAKCRSRGYFRRVVNRWLTSSWMVWN